MDKEPVSFRTINPCVFLPGLILDRSSRQIPSNFVLWYPVTSMVFGHKPAVLFLIGNSARTYKVFPTVYCSQKLNLRLSKYGLATQSIGL